MKNPPGTNDGHVAEFGNYGQSGSENNFSALDQLYPDSYCHGTAACCATRGRLERFKNYSHRHLIGVVLTVVRLCLKG